MRSDPLFKQRLTFFVVAMVLIWPMLQLAQFRPSALFDADNLGVIKNFLSQFFPPRVDLEFLRIVLTATLETLAMATTGITLALVIAIPLGLVMAFSLSISRLGPASGHQWMNLLRYGARLFMLLLRGIPDIVWALLFVRIFGLGVVAGVMAIAITYGGMLAKVYAEILESGNTQCAKALMISGSGRIQAFLYGLLPLTSQELASYTIYRWEAAIRTSVIMGFVGAGGLGQLMDQSMKMLVGNEVATVLIVFLTLVLIADSLSWYIRKQLQ
jgi:phosphonate transport system permease protein